MEMIQNWLGEQAGIVGLVQIVLDLTLIAFVAVVVMGRRKTNTDNDAVSRSLDKIIAETKAIAGQLDTNLQERQKLIQQVVGKLDQRLDEARELCQKLDSLNKEVQSGSLTPAAIHRDSVQKEIARLARLGLDAGAISERLQKPLGEVELVLSLNRLIPER